MESLEPPMSGNAPNAQGEIAALLQSLNEPQRRAAMHKDGPLVVFAGAGSGKTRIIAHRIAWLIEQGVHPWEIFAVTFTNKAAQEMRERVQALTPLGSRCLISTFHSSCARWLREFAPELGFTSDFTIYDDDDATKAIKSILKELNVKLDDEVTATEYKSAINKLKTMALLPNDERLKREYAGLLPPLGQQVYQRYQEYLAACNAMDFGDLIMNMLLLLRRNEKVRHLMQRRYRYILVDEYQDTNRTQFELIARLAEAHRNLFVVGDDDQSIYSWRGAMPANIIDFDKVYPDALKVTLEQNYRCSANIVNAAAAMIANNQYRVEKSLFTDNPPGDPINYRFETDNELEAWWVVDQIKSEHARFALSDIAVFYRTNSQSRLMEDALRRENIPYQIYGTVRFYDRAEIKDIMAYFRLIMNPNDDISVKRILNVPTRGIGKKAEETLEAEASRRGLPLLKTVETVVEENLKLAAKFRDFNALIVKLRAALVDGPLDEALETLLNATKYFDYVKKKFPDAAQDKIENVLELGAALSDFASAYPDATLAEWLQSVTLSSSEGNDGKGVSMMTLHMAKGLEFKRVYIVGVEENLLPHRNSLEDSDSLEEERRLFYVGMTRAREKLSLTSAYRRRVYNQWMANKPSRFLAEIPADVFETSTDINPPIYAGSSYYQSNDVRYDYDEPSHTSQELTIGQKVHHPTYGRGTVEGLADEFGLLKATVRFDEFGLRKVIARHLNA